MNRTEKLKAMLKVRTKPDGTPQPGFAENVAAIKAELAKREPQSNG